MLESIPSSAFLATRPKIRAKFLYNLLGSTGPDKEGKNYTLKEHRTQSIHTGKNQVGMVELNPKGSRPQCQTIKLAKGEFINMGALFCDTEFKACKALKNAGGMA